MISIIIPAHNEEKYLNRTIDNFYKKSTGEIEVIVVLNGYDQEVDKRAKVIRYANNLGERVAMNTAASVATGEYLFRIDAHCDITKGWDEMMASNMSEKKILIAVITAMDEKWENIPGHWYGFCNLLPTMEEKWLVKKKYKTIEENMSFTGCGFMISKKFYDSFGGADESLPPMGAIGPEFSLRGWVEGDGCYTHTEVIISHIFNTGGYGLDGVLDARKALQVKYEEKYKKLLKIFPEEETLKCKTGPAEDKKRMVTVDKTVEHTTTSLEGKVLKMVVEHFKYIYEDDGKGPSEKEIEVKYGPMAHKVGVEVFYPDHNGILVKVE